MKIIPSIFVMGILLMISTVLSAAHMPVPDDKATLQILKSLNNALIKGTSSYNAYTIACGMRVQSWDQIPGALCFSTNHAVYASLSNEYPAVISIDDTLWPTVEHFYHAMKFVDPVLQRRICNAKTVQEACSISTENIKRVRKDWLLIHIAVMAVGVYTKFGVYNHLADLLMSTDSRVLIKADNSYDSYFGAGQNFQGLNYEGRILMQMRNYLNSQKGVTAWSSNVMPSLQQGIPKGN